jgi:hypothetical protein
VQDLFGFIARLIWKSTIDLLYIARMIPFACTPLIQQRQVQRQRGVFYTAAKADVNLSLRCTYETDENKMTKTHFLAGILVLSLLLSACGAPAAPTESLPDIQATAAAAAQTIVAETLTALPTPTSLPPSDTPAPSPTNTPAPPPTIEPTATLTFTATPQPAAADPCNAPLTSWQGPSASLNITYEYTPQKKDDKVVVSIWVKSDRGECGYLYNLSSGPVGQYTVIAYIDGVKDFTVSGGFRITEGAWKIVIRNDRIVALGVCYPDC